MSNLPRLPEEVWTNVFAFATLVPFALDTGPPNAFAYPSQWEEKQIQDGILKSKAIKRHLTLVCKQWNKLTLSLLYEIIDIRDVRTITKLARTFKAFDTMSSPNNHALGKWTIRLDIDLWMDIDVDWAGLEAILRSLSSLEIIAMAGSPSSTFIYTFHYSLPKWLVSQNIRKIDQNFISSSFHFPIISTQKNLRFLRITSTNNTIKTLDSATMDRIANVEFMDIPNILLGDLIRLDALQMTTHMNLVGRSRYITDMARTACSHCLTSLSIPAIGYAIPFLSIASSSLSSIICDVTDTFPNLQELVICFARQGEEKELEADRFPPIKKLGFRVALLAASSKDFFRELCPRISTIVRNFRTIEVVRMINRLPAEDMIDVGPDGPHIMKPTSIDLFSTYAVRFENSEGRLFHEEPDEPVSSPVVI